MHIFISYPRKDKDKALQLKDILFKGGQVVWIDNQLTTGLAWRQQLEAEIKKSDAIALALTPNWLASPYCQWEFITAVENGKKVIPVLLDAVAPLPDRLGQYQYADFKDGFDDLVKVQKFLDDLVTLAVPVERERIAGMDKAEYAAKIDQEHHGSGHNINVGGTNNKVAGGNMDNRKTDIHIGGSVSGGIVNVGGKQEFKESVTVNMGHTPAASADVQQRLERLSQQLTTNLAALPHQDKDDADAIQTLVHEAITEARKDKPNLKLLKLKSNTLTESARNMPTIAPTVAQIVETLSLIK